MRLWQKIEALGVVDQDLRRVGVALPELAAFVEFFFQEQRGKHGAEIISLARELQSAYARLRRLGELALERLAELKITMDLPEEYGDLKEMAQTVQNIFAKKNALQPESEGVSSR